MLGLAAVSLPSLWSLSMKRFLYQLVRHPKRTCCYSK